MTTAENYSPTFKRLQRSLQNWTDEELLLARQTVLQVKESTSSQQDFLQALDHILYDELSRRLIEVLELERLYFRE